MLYDLLIAKGQTHASTKQVPEYNELALLIQNCIAQQPSAQKRLYDKFSPMVYGIIKRYFFKDERACGEILNDSFLKIFTKLDQYSFQGAFEGWIRKIVVNTVTDYLRKNIKDKHQFFDVMPEETYVDTTSIQKLSYKELLTIIHTLPETQRSVFCLHVLDNCSHKEISELLEISEGNSRWHLNDARKRLKEKLIYLNSK